MKSILRRARRWALRVLNAVDRQACVDFANDHLTTIKGTPVMSGDRVMQARLSDGAVIYGDYCCIVDSTISGTVYVAPWCRDVVLSGNLFREGAGDGRTAPEKQTGHE